MNTSSSGKPLKEGRYYQVLTRRMSLSEVNQTQYWELPEWEIALWKDEHFWFPGSDVGIDPRLITDEWGMAILCLGKEVSASPLSGEIKRDTPNQDRDCTIGDSGSTGSDGDRPIPPQFIKLLQESSESD
jgi:hypothetical protein